MGAGSIPRLQQLCIAFGVLVEIWDTSDVFSTQAQSDTHTASIRGVVPVWKWTGSSEGHLLYEQQGLKHMS